MNGRERERERTTVMPPREVFIVRHGEREDHKDKSFSLRTSRPHDPPLTDNGVGMAEALGTYLRTHYGLEPSSVVVLSSPLLRCVQTAAGIIRGLRGEPPSSAGATKEKEGGTTADPPLYIEPCLAESAVWEYTDLKRNPEVARKGFLQCPDPLWLPATTMQATVCPHVRLQRDYQLGVETVMTVVNHELVEADFEHRCRLAAQAVSRSAEPVFANKAVICVSHGEASVTWFSHMATDPTSVDTRENPCYTAFMHLRPEGAPAKDGGELRWVAQLPAFSTPHLPEAPSEY